ncbi:hypothetical protein [Candidatus Clostridium radicumherbarum]|uniref:Uncharacterized protein n=1 Tax=Candidatus Clostridium radicumherbarum TaxID=3381662 RepID=A0ABW8TXQ8_9CLOT
MKKIKTLNIPLIIGYINWSVLIALIAVFIICEIINPNVTPVGLSIILDILGIYLTISWIPSIISIYLILKNCENNKQPALTINSIFLGGCILFFLFFFNIMRWS